MRGGGVKTAQLILFSNGLSDGAGCYIYIVRPEVTNKVTGSFFKIKQFNQSLWLIAIHYWGPGFVGCCIKMKCIELRVEHKRFM